MPKFNPLDHPICFSQPLRLASRADLAHVPFAMFLVDVLNPKVLVELGVREGTLFCSYSQAVRQLKLSARCFAIGDWPNGHSDPGDLLSLANLRAHHDPLYGGFSQLIQVAPGEADKNFENGAVDLLHISGRSSNEAPGDWIKNWLPKMSNRGVIVLDHINLHDSESNVWKLWKDLKADRPYFELAHQGGLGVLSVGTHTPDGLEALFEANDKEASLIREFFRQSGEQLKAQLANKPEIEQLYSRVKDQFIQLQREELETREKEARLKSLLAEIEIVDKEREKNLAELDRLSATVDQLSPKETQLNNILNSRAWRWVSRYGRFKRRYLAPAYSLLRHPA